MSFNLDLTEHQKMLKKSALDFIQQEVSKNLLEEIRETETGITDELWRKMVDLGWLGILIPEQYGGLGSTLMDTAVLFEALGAAPMTGPYFSSGILGSLIVMEAGTEAQKKSLLPAVAEGKEILALAQTEPGYSWESDGIQVTATSKNSEFVLDGVKLFAMDAKAATHLIVAARTSKGADPAKGISLFLVNTKAEGVSIRHLPGFLTGAAFEVKLNKVKVPASAILGQKDEGWTGLKNGINKAIPILCAYKTGGCQSLLVMSLDYSRTRVQFGQVIGKFQRVQDLIVEIINNLEMARWTTYEALWKLDTGLPAELSVHMAKAVSSEAYWQSCTLGHRVFSGISYSKEHPVSFHTKASRSLYNFLGDPSYHRWQMARLLGVAK